MIVGSVTTTPCIAVATEAYNDRMFLLTPSASSTEVTEGKDNVFQICFTDPSQGKLSAECISEKALGTKIAVIYNNADAYSTGIYQTFEAEAQALGLEIVSVTTFTDDTTDFSVQVTSAKEAGADLVFLPMYYTPASMILKTADSMGYKPVFFGVDGMDGILNIEGFDTSLAEGVMVLTPFAGDSANELAKTFIANYEAAYGATPDQFAADAYDAMYTLYAATKAAGVTADTSTEDGLRDAGRRHEGSEDQRRHRHDRRNDLERERRSQQGSYRRQDRQRRVCRPWNKPTLFPLPVPGFPGAGIPAFSRGNQRQSTRGRWLIAVGYLKAFS